MIFNYNLLGSSANTGPMVFWTTAIAHIWIHGFRCFSLILEVQGLGNEVWALLGFVSSLGWALTLLTFARWLLAAPTMPFLAFWALICVIMCFRHSSQLVGRAWWFFINSWFCFSAISKTEIKSENLVNFWALYCCCRTILEAEKVE